MKAPKKTFLAMCIGAIFYEWTEPKWIQEIDDAMWIAYYAKLQSKTV